MVGVCMLGDIYLQYRKTVLVEFDPAAGLALYPNGRVVSLTEGPGDWEGLPSRVVCCVPYLDEAVEITGLLPGVIGEIRDRRERSGDVDGRTDRMLMAGWVEGPGASRPA